MNALSAGGGLTISIPTFDRPDPLLKLLESLLPQADDEIVIRILDNCSRIPVEGLVRRHFGTGVAQRIRFHRNNANIGGNANIMRCIEMCETRWLWMIGDDNEVYPGALETARAAIAGYPDRILLNFQTSVVTRTECFTTTGVDEFARKVDSLSMVFFISTNIYCAEALKSNVRLGYQYTASWLPHLYTVLRTLGKDGRCQFLDKPLVYAPPKPDIKQTVSFVGYSVGCGLLLDVPMQADSRRSLARKMYYHLPFYCVRLYFHLALMRRQGVPAAEVSYQGLQIYYRWFIHCAWPLFGIFHRICLLLAIWFPNLFAWSVVNAANRFTSRTLSMDELPDATARL